MDLGEIVKRIETKGNMDLSVFREPRGVCRVLQLLISILAGLAIYGFEGVETIKYCDAYNPLHAVLSYSYPFQLTTIQETLTCGTESVTVKLAIDDSFSQYSEYFFFVCVISILYCFAAIVIYSKCTQSYETNDKYPLVDFVGTVFIAVLWLFASAAWTHGLSGLKTVTAPSYFKAQLQQLNPNIFKFVDVSSSGYFGLNVSAILGCLSFFLWASDLWFLYKETSWFQGRHGQAVDSPA